MAAAALTAKQQRFVEEYLVDLNATAAYKRAGYACKSGRAAEAAASRLLRNVKVQEAIAAAQVQLSRKLEIKAEAILGEYARIAFSDLGQVLDFSAVEPRLRPACDIPEDARRAISSVKVRRYLEGRGDDAREVEVTEYKLWSKLDALSKLADHLDLFKAQKKPLQVDVTSGGKPIERNSLTADDLIAIAGLVAAAGGALCPDGGSQPVDTAHAPSAAAAFSPAL